MAAALAAAVAAGTLGYPQCPVNQLDCLYTFATDGIATFGDLYQTSFEDGNVFEYVPATACNVENWRRKEQCHKACALQLEVVEPAEARFSFCLEDNIYEPYVIAGHLHERHNLNGKEMDMVMMPGLEDCNPAFDAVDVAGKVVFLRYPDHGNDCGFASSALVEELQSRMARAVVFGSSRTFNEIVQHNYGSYSLWGDGTDIPAALAPRQHGDVLRELLDAGQVLKVKYLFSCAPPGVPLPAVGESCPHPGLRDLCADAEKEEDRLCNYCPGYISTGDVRVCLWGHTLLPRAEKNSFESAFALPHAIQGDVVVVRDLPQQGCTRSDYDGFAGRVVVVRRTGMDCTPYNAVRAAAAANVAGFVYANDIPAAAEVHIQGHSNFVDIPVGSLSTNDYWDLVDEGKRQGNEYTADGTLLWTLAGVTLEPGAWLPRSGAGDSGIANKTLAPTAEEVLIPKFAVPAGAVTCIVLSGLLVAGVVVYSIARQKLDATTANNNEALQAQGVPLRLASLALSLGILLAVSFVAFGLAAEAGDRATADVTESGQEAMDAAADLSVSNLAAMTQSFREQVSDSVAKEIRIQLQFLGELMDMFVKMSAVRAASLDEDQRDTLIDAFHFFNNFWEDDSPLGIYVPIVSLFLANGIGFKRERAYWHNDMVEIGYELRPFAPLRDSMSRASAGTKIYEAPVATWKSNWYGYEREAEVISVTMPVHNGNNEFLGVLTAAVPIEVIGHFLENVRAPGTYSSNMSIAWYTPLEKKILYSVSARFGPRQQGHFHREAVVHFKENYDGWGQPIVVTHTLHQALDPELAGYARVLDRKFPDGAWGPHDGEFDQRAEWETGTIPAVEMQVGCDGDGPVVLEGTPRRMELQDRWGKTLARGSGVVQDSGRNVLRFDGDMQMFADNNLSATVPLFGEAHRMTIDGTNRTCIGLHEGRGSGPATECLVLNEIVSEVEFSISVQIKPDAPTGSFRAGSTTPVIFTDALYPTDPMIRFYVTGELWLNAKTYGCRIPPFPSGVPAGQWTTLTARISHEEEVRCSVYVNGTEHASAPITHMYRADQTATSVHYVGMNYAGLMDNFTFVNYTISDAEAMSLHQDGRLVRNVPSKVWYAMNDPSMLEGRSGLVSLLPREDVLREVLRNIEETRRKMDDTRAATQVTLDEARWNNVSLVVLLVILSCVILSVFNYFLTEPFTRVALVMHDAAQMKIDDFPNKASFINEVNAMQSAMATLMKNLAEYRAYMPTSILDTVPHDDQRRLAMVFTDIRSSTVLWDTCPQGMATGLKMHNRIIRERIRELGGQEVKTIGDAFMVTFLDPSDACLFGTLVLEDLVNADWPEELLQVPAARRTEDGAWNGINIRVGINYGVCEVVMSGEGAIKLDFFGPTVNIAARVEAAALPGSLCITHAVMQEICMEDLGSPAVLDMGERELKGVTNKVRLYTLLPQTLKARLDDMRATLEKGAEPEEVTTRPMISAINSGSLGGSLSVGSDLKLRLRGGLQPHLGMKDIVLGKTLFRMHVPQADQLRSVNAALQAVVSAVQRTSSTVLAVVGESVTHSWTGVRQKDRVKSSFEYVQHLEQLLRPTRVSVGGGVVAHVGLCSAKSMVGNIGEGDVRAATVVGPCVALTDILTETACDLDCAALYSALGRDIALSYKSLSACIRPVDVWTIGRDSAVEITVYQVSVADTRKQDFVPTAGDLVNESSLLDVMSLTSSVHSSPALSSTSHGASMKIDAEHGWSEDFWWRMFNAPTPEGVRDLSSLPEHVFIDPVARQIRDMLASKEHLRKMPLNERFLQLRSE